MKVLVLNCFSRNSIAVINSLDSTYELIGAYQSNKTSVFNSIQKWFCSNRVSHLVTYSNPKVADEKFKTDIINACNKFAIDTVIATGTTTTNYLSYFKQEIESATKAKLLVEDYETFSRLTDKWETYKICRDVGMPVPKTVLIEDKQSVIDDVCQLKFPIVAKPRISFASHGVMFFNNPEEFKQNLHKLTGFQAIDGSEEAPYIVQEMIVGKLHDVCLCAKQGEIAMLMTQQRLMSLRDFGGGGIVNITTDEPEMAALAEKLVKAMHWNGLALFDFIKTDQGQYYLLEINPKVWGTTRLTTEAGINMVQCLVDLFVLNKPLQRQFDYEKDVLYRWVFPECLAAWFMQPLNPQTVWRRIKKTFNRAGAKRIVSNVNRKDFLHLIGTVLRKAS